MTILFANWRKSFLAVVPDYPDWQLSVDLSPTRPEELDVSHMRAWWLFTAFGGRLSRSVYGAMTSYCQVGGCVDGGW